VGGVYGATIFNFSSKSCSRGSVFNGEDVFMKLPGCFTGTKTLQVEDQYIYLFIMNL